MYFIVSMSRIGIEVQFTKESLALLHIRVSIQVRVKLPEHQLALRPSLSLALSSRRFVPQGKLSSFVSRHSFLIASVATEDGYLPSR
jgi:hypothetical protein